MNRRAMLPLVFLSSLGALQPCVATGAPIIVGVTATTNMGSLNASTTPDKMVDESGLTGADLTSLAGTHDAADHTGWKSAVGVTSGTITFDLHGLYLLDAVGVWNHPQLSGQRGVRAVEALVSVDGVVFSAFVGAPSMFAQKIEPVSAEVFDFPDVLAAYVRFVVKDGYGAVNTGISEVRFSGSPTRSVPEPAAVLLLIGASGWVAGHSRRRRHRRRLTGSTSFQRLSVGR